MKMLPHVASVLSLSACLFASTGAMAQDTSAAPAANGNGPVKNIVLVHGTWADGSSWAKVIPLLQAKGYQMAEPGNYTAGGFSENTVFHEDDTDKAQADEVAEALGGQVAVEERPASFTRCRGGIPVVVVTAVSGA